MSDRSYGKISYHHTQVGYTTLIFLGISVLVILWVCAKQDIDLWILFVLLGVFLVVAMFFATQTIEIKQDLLRVRQGVGLVQKKIRLDEIKTCEAVRNKWYYGWGVRKIPHGWLYSVSGLKAVQIIMKNGSRIRFGTDEPESVCQAIRRLTRPG